MSASGSSGSGGGLSFPSELLGLVPFVGQLRDVGAWIRAYGSFRLAVLGVVLGYIVNGFLQIGRMFVDVVFLAADPFIQALGLAELGITFSIASAGSTLIGVLRDTQVAVAELVGVAGPAAPIIGAIIMAIVIVGAYYALKLVLGAIPIADTLNQFL